jgi:hypothetical protein
MKASAGYPVGCLIPLVAVLGAVIIVSNSRDRGYRGALSPAVDQTLRSAQTL